MIQDEMIKLIIGLFIYFGLRLVYDILCIHLLFNQVQRDIVYYISEWVLAGIVVYYVFENSYNTFQKVVCLSFGVVILVRISLNLFCFDCTKETYYDLVRNPIIDKLMWFPVAVILTYGVIKMGKWASSSGLGKFMSR